MTATVAYFGFRSFERWKREQLEERRMELAFQALKLAYQSTFVFETIRSPLIASYEWADMPERKGDNDNKRSQRGTRYSIGKRMESHEYFFKAVWDIQPAFMAMFGEEMQGIFYELHMARRYIEIACQMLNHHLDDAQLAPEPDKELWQQLRADLCGAEAPFAPEGDRVGKRIASFKTGIERVCLPVVKHRAGK